jgi:ParB-like chromosome segregation protein Spo0J
MVRRGEKGGKWGRSSGGKGAALALVAQTVPAIRERINSAPRFECVDVSSIRPEPRNPRHHDDRQIARIGASIREFGFLAPLIIDKANRLVAGHGRLAAAKLLGLDRVPVVRADHLSDKQVRGYRLADNRLAELSVWDQHLLEIELTELSALSLDFDIELTGFDTADIDRLTGAIDRTTDDPADDVPELQDTSVSRRGDLWKLGSHRLFCGDATLPETFQQLVGSNPAQMMFTDPPYNVRIRGNVSKRGHREFPMASGEMITHEFIAFLGCALRCAWEASQDGAIHYVCMDWRHLAPLIEAAAPVYGEPKQLCVWVKDNAGMGSFYRSQHELVAVYKVGDAPHINNFGLGERGRYRTNVWKYAGATSRRRDANNPFDMHPTVKPVALVVDAIKDCSRRSGVILDPFGGSGTTLIAAERTGRIARIAELDPAYVDLTIRRWEALTGEHAVDGKTGLPFCDLALERLSADR